jgi:hypothetical protein
MSELAFSERTMMLHLRRRDGWFSLDRLAGELRRTSLLASQDEFDAALASLASRGLVRTYSFSPQGPVEVALTEAGRIFPLQVPPP